MADANDYVERLTATDAVREPLLRAVINDLQLPRGSRGLDTGCGTGRPATLLAEAIGPAGHVTGVDVAPEVVRCAEQLVQDRSLTQRITFQEADVNRLPFGDATFDWAWSADCVGYPVSADATPLRELVRVVKPGGAVLLLAWTSQCLLPGYALLEARLNATCSSYAPYMRDMPPEAHFGRALGWLRAAGLADLEARTFVGDLQAPLTDEVRHGLAALFAMLWDERQPGLDAADRAALDRLCRPTAPDYILDLPDYYGFFTYTLFRGTRPHTTGAGRLP